MAPNPKLVEALAREIVPLVAFWNGEEDTHPDDCSDAAWIEAREMAAAFFNRYRIVQLPEEPSGWTDSGWASCFGDPDTPSTQVYKERRSWMDPLPIYIIPGDPQEVEP